jgi:hypothetical protein
MAFRIDKHVVRITAGLGVGNDGVIGRGQHEQPRRTAKDDQNPVSLSIERHRKIRVVALGRHGSGDLTFDQIDHSDFPCIRHIDEGSSAVLVDLKTFGVCLEPDVRHFRLAFRVDDGECTLAISDQHPVARPVDSNVISVIAQVDASDGRQILGAQYANRSVPAICDMDRIGRGFVGDPLRFFQPRQRVLDPGGREVHDADAVVSEFGDKEPLPLEVEGEMVDATAHRTERNLCLKGQRRVAGLCLALDCAHQQHRPDQQRTEHGFSPLEC